MRTLVTSILLAGASTPALAEDWYYVSDSDEGIVYADSDSVRPAGEVLAVAAFFGSAEPLDVREEPPPYVIWYEIARFEFLCSSRQYRVTHTDSFNQRRLLEYSRDLDEDWASIPGDSLAESLREFACDGTRISAVGDPFEFTDGLFEDE
jgi:hypothetical protein